MTTERTFTATEIVKALHAEFKNGNELSRLNIIEQREARGRGVAIISIAKALGVGDAYIDYQPQPDAGKSGE